MPSCENLNSANMDKYKLKSYGCHACPVQCGAKVKVKNGQFATESEVRRPEYETLAALGTLCLVDNIEAVIRANEICNLYGIDTMSCGTSIAFAFECYENGLITKEDTDGMELNWGDAEALVTLVEKIAARKGFGDVLADGVAKAAERIGKGSEKYAMHIRGQGLPYHDPRIDPCRGTNYIADANPSHHVGTEQTIILEHGGALGSDPLLNTPKLEKYGDFDKKGEMYVLGAAVSQLLSAAGLCGLLAIDNTIPTAEFIAAVTGWDFDWEEGVNAGRRISTLRQAFNVREGLSPEDFKLPKRVTEPLSIGAAAGVKVDFDTLRKNYFKAMGWDDKTGKPKRETLVELNLDKLTSDL
jgi:aldehyde:ferredoxin oxidoreductase